MESEIEGKSLINKDVIVGDAHSIARDEQVEEDTSFVQTSQKESNTGDEKITLLNLSKSLSEKDHSYKTFENVEETTESLDEHTPMMKNVEENPARINELAPKQMKIERMNSHRTDLQLDIKAAAKHNSRQFDTSIRLDSPSTPSAKGTPKPINIAVFLKEGASRLLQLDKGKLTTAGEVKNMMFEVLSMPKTAYNIFSIWMISPYLEIQLKRHHVPYLLRKQWPDIVMRFSTCEKRELAEQDEPVLVFQRNSFCSVENEKMFIDETVLKRLFEEARYNIVSAIYKIPAPDAEMLGGMLLRIEYGPYEPTIHKPGYFKKMLSKFLPYYAIGSNKIIQKVRSSKAELRLLQQYEHASNKTNDVSSCQRMFLEYCQSLPCYGSAFFKGSIVHKGAKWKLLGSYEKSVVVAINRVGLTLMREGVDSIHLPFDHLSWEYLKDEENGTTDTLCLEYDSIDESGESVAEQIQVISKQACMMDTMVDSCVNYMNIMSIPITPICLDYKKLGDISYSTMPSKKHNFTLSRPFKR